MSPTLLLTKATSSLKTEMIVVLVVLATVTMLPFVAFASVTNIGALFKSNPQDEAAPHLYQGPTSTTNTYTFGYCTFWAAKRREDIGKAIPNNWGDAHTWDDNARLAGYNVDHTPSVGAIMETDAGSLGHVAFVEKVEPDGHWAISEMNAPIWDAVTHRTFTIAQALEYNFIH